MSDMKSAFNRVLIGRPFIFPVILLFILLVTFFIYQPGLSGTFVFDDMPNILKNPRIAIPDLSFNSLKQAAFSSASGPLMRPVSMLSFAINYSFTEFDPFYFKVTNLIIHLLNGIGIFTLTTLLLNIYLKRFQPKLLNNHVQWVSMAITAAWLLHPFNLTSVLYIVQRMTSLSTFFTIWGIVFYMRGRIRLYDGENGFVPILASMLIFAPLATLSKETGALLPIFICIVEITLFNFKVEKPFARRFIIIFFIITVAIPAIAALIYLAIHPNWILSGYQNRTFTLVERVMTEARVLWFYIRLILVPSINQMGLFHDDIINSQGLLQPISTLFSLAGIALLFALALALRKKAPLVTFGILFFFAGHVLESTVFALEITYEHRNYLPMYGLLLILFFYLLYPLKYADTLCLRQLVAVLLIGIFAFNTYTRSEKWANPFDLALSEVEYHPNSPRNNSEMGSIYANLITKDPSGTERNYLIARQYFEKSTALDPNFTDGLFGLIRSSSVRGKVVDTDLVNELELRLAHANFANNIGDQLLSLIICQTKDICKLTNTQVEGLLQAASRNPTLSGLNRSTVMSAQAYYLVNVERDYPAAVTAMHQTIESAPLELEYRVTLIRFLIALQHYDKARQELAILKQLDKMQLHQKQIASLDQQLMAR